MQVNVNNAVVVAAIFDKLSDERFNMRTIDAIRRGTAIETDEAVLAAATEMGCPILHRLRDNAPLITRPIMADGARRMTHLECRANGDKALAVVNGGEAFDLPTYRVTFSDAASGLGGGDNDGVELDSNDDDIVGEE